jgi:small subunit ribosomal protein S15
MITTEAKAELVKNFGAKFGANDKDSGCTAVQVAILTARINDLKGHFAANKHDHHSNTGLLKMIGRRRSLLRYFRTHNEDKYKTLIGELGLRK